MVGYDNKVHTKLREAIEADIRSSAISWKEGGQSRTRIFLCGSSDQAKPDPRFPIAALRRQIGQLIDTLEVREPDQVSESPDLLLKARKLKEIGDILWMIELIGIVCDAKDQVPEVASGAMVEAHTQSSAGDEEVPASNECCEGLLAKWQGLVGIADDVKTASGTASAQCLELLRDIATYLGYFAGNEHIDLSAVSKDVYTRATRKSGPGRDEGIYRIPEGVAFKANFMLIDKAGVYARLLAVLQDEAAADLIVSASCSKLPYTLAEAEILFSSKDESLTQEGMQSLLRKKLGEDFLWVSNFEPLGELTPRQIQDLVEQLPAPIVVSRNL